MVLLEVARRDVEVPGLQRTGNVCGGIVEREQCDGLALLEDPVITSLPGLDCAEGAPPVRHSAHELFGGLVPAPHLGLFTTVFGRPSQSHFIQVRICQNSSRIDQNAVCLSPKLRNLRKLEKVHVCSQIPMPRFGGKICNAYRCTY